MGLFKVAFIFALLSVNVKSNQLFDYPKVHRDYGAIDEYHGKLIVDPYQWLEDPDSPETKEFVDAQNALTKSYLETSEDRRTIQETLKELWNYPKYGNPHSYGSRYFFTENTGLQNQSVLYYKEDLKGKEIVLVDPNALSEEGIASISNYEPSRDGKWLAYSLAMAGSDWQTFYFMNVDTLKQNEGEKLPFIKFSGVSWTSDGKGVFYARYSGAKDERGRKDGTETDVTDNLKLYYHFLGTDYENDVLIFDLPEHPKRLFSPEVTENGKFLILEFHEGFSANSIVYAEIPEEITGKLEFKPIFDKWDAKYSFIEIIGTKAYFHTSLKAPNNRIISYDMIESYIEEVIPEDKKNTISEGGVDLIYGDKLVVSYIEDVKSVLRIFDLKTKKFIHTIPIPVGKVGSVSVNSEKPEFFFTFASFTVPTRVYKVTYGVDTGDEFNLEVYKSVDFKGIDLDEIETKQVFYPSTDGTLIPMYIVGKKGITSKVPALLYGYGGFNIELLPFFKLPNLVFIQYFNGVFALANLRGGGEYGKHWHDSGRLFKKQNVFDDFHSAAEYLISENYTDSSMLTINGGSNGGLLVGACLNQRPDLYRVAIPAVGVLDMLKFHKFTIGHAWVSEYGSSDDKEQFEYLLKYSPIHNVIAPQKKSVQYPAVLVTTGDHDDRVVPLHSYKFISELQYKIGQNQNQKNPLLITIEKDAGHGSGKPVEKQIKEHTDILTFIGKSLGIYFGRKL